MVGKQIAAVINGMSSGDKTCIMPFSARTDSKSSYPILSILCLIDFQLYYNSLGIIFDWENLIE